MEGPGVLRVVLSLGGKGKANEHKSEARQWAVLLHGLALAPALSACLPWLLSMMYCNLKVEINHFLKKYYFYSQIEGRIMEIGLIRVRLSFKKKSRQTIFL